MAICRKVTYSGQVQGVGFRYTVQRLAAGMKVTGYVKNLANGDVELVAEGEATEVETLLRRVAQQMNSHIRDTHVLEESAQGFRDFRITH